LSNIIARPVRFGDDLAYEDRKTLRAVVRKVHGRFFSGHPTNAQVDQLIDALGPVVQQKLLMAKIKADTSL